MPDDPRPATVPIPGDHHPTARTATKGQTGSLPIGEGLYSRLVNALGGIVWEADGETFHFTFVSQQAEQILGYPVQQWLDEPTFWRDHMHPDDADWCMEFCLNATSRREDHDFQYRMIAADGRVVWLQNIVLVRVEGNGSVRLHGIMIDITEHKVANEELSLSESRFRTTFEKSGSGLALVDMRGFAITCNPAWLDLFGFSQAEMSSRMIGEFTYGADLGVDVELYQELLAGKRDKYEIEKRFVTKDGRVIWGNLIVTLIKDRHGKPKYAIDMLQDITERKQAEHELQEVSERLQLATKAAGIGIWDWDVRKDELVWDDGMYRLFGIRREEFSGAYDAWVQALAPADSKRALAAVQASLSGERELDLEFRNVWPDGSIHFIKAAAQTFHGQNGQPVRMVGVNYDITERKRAEEELRWSEEQLRLLLDSTAEGIFGVDLEGRCIFCNAAGLRLLGYDQPADLLGRTMHDLIAHSRADGTPFPPEDCPASNSLLWATIAFSDTDVFWRRDGTCFPTEYWSHPMFRENQHVGAVVTFLDLTGRRRTEESLRLSEERFAKAFQASPEPMAIFRDADEVLLEANERWTSVYGWTREEAVGRTARELNQISIEDWARLRGILNQQQTVRDIEVNLITRSGEIRNVSLSAEQIVVNDERCNLFLHLDVTERRRAEVVNSKLIHDLGERVKELTALHETARILQDEGKSITELLAALVALIPPSWQYPEIAAARIVLGAMEFATANFAPSTWSQTAKFEAADLTGLIEVVYLEERPPENDGPFLLEERKLLDLLAEMTSSTLERRFAQSALTESERRIRQLTDNVRDVLWLYTPDWSTLLYISPAYETIWGRSCASLYHDPRSSLEAVHPDDRDRVQATVDAAGDRGFDHEYRVVRPDGTESWIWDRGFPIKDHSGTMFRIAGIAEDITERKLAEQRLKTSSEQLRALSASLRSAKEEEGIRIARELHDELGSLLTSLKWSLMSLDKSTTAELRPLSRRDKIEEMVGLVDATINTVRRISSELRPSVLDDLGLISAVEWHAQQFQASTGLACRFESSLEHVEMKREQATAVFRIFQEALTNVLRHAQASTAQVLIEREDDEFVLEIRDNGKGISEVERLGLNSLGLLGMRERAHAIGGKVEIKGGPGKGTVVTVRLPLGE